jgi:transposase
LPSYSPDFNPIELAFSKFKAYIRRRQPTLASITSDDEDNIDSILFLHDAVWSVTPKDAEGYFKHCGYF